MGSTLYYKNNIDTLIRIFGTSNIRFEDNLLLVNEKQYPIIDDVIVTLSPDQYPSDLKNRLHLKSACENQSEFIAKDIQYTFGEEWKKFNDIKPEHAEEFKQYFDIVDLNSLKSKCICDLGCGIGRWDFF